MVNSKLQVNSSPKFKATSHLGSQRKKKKHPVDSSPWGQAGYTLHLLFAVIST